MKDMVPKGTGDSRFLRSSIPADITFEQFISMLRAGTFPFDFAGLNAAGIAQEGTPLNKSTLLRDETAAKLGMEGDKTVDDAFNQLAAGGITRPGDIIYSIQKEPLPGWYRCDGSVTEDEVLKELLPVPLDRQAALVELNNTQQPFGAPFLCNDKYIMMLGTPGSSSSSLWWADDIAGPYAQISGTSYTFRWLKYQNGLYYYYYNNNSAYTYVYTQPNLENTTNRQQVFTFNRQMYQNCGIVEFKGKEYCFYNGYQGYFSIFELFITPTVGLNQIAQISDSSHNTTFNHVAVSDDMLVCFNYNATNTIIAYSTDVTTWEWITGMAFDVTGFTCSQYALRYSKVLKKWIMPAYRNSTNSSSLITQRACVRIFMHEDITKINTEYVDIVIPDLLSSMTYLQYIEVANDCFFRGVAQDVANNSIYIQYTLNWDATTQKWVYTKQGFSSSSSGGVEYAPDQFVSFGDVGALSATVRKTSGSNTYNYAAVQLYDIRKHLPEIENGFIKGGDQ